MLSVELCIPSCWHSIANKVHYNRPLKERLVSKEDEHQSQISTVKR